MFEIPLQVGGIKPGCFKIGNTGGMLDNILSSKLYRPGSVAYVSRSGGMSNELNTSQSLVLFSGIANALLSGIFDSSPLVHTVCAKPPSPTVLIVYS